MKRLTHRKEDKVYTDALSVNCTGTFCKHVANCNHIVTRECPHLKLIDTIANIEDKCEECGVISLEHLFDVITYCKSVGIIDKISKMYTEEEEQ